MPLRRFSHSQTQTTRIESRCFAHGEEGKNRQERIQVLASALPFTLRSQKKQEELKEEIASISGIAEAKLLYGSTEWTEFHLHDSLVQKLTQIQCAKPTVIQEKAIEAAFRGKDVLGAAPTGSGKTLAFCVPVIDWLLKHGFEEPAEKAEWNVRCIIISPTRELSLQINRVITRLTENTNIR